MKKPKKLIQLTGQLFLLFTIVCIIIRIVFYVSSFYFNTINRLIHLF